MQSANLSTLARGRENNFDFLRFFFALLVIYSHSYALVLTRAVSERTEPFRILTRGQAAGGALAVDGFFIISGFLIARSWFSSKGLFDYLKKRVLRIYPGFIVAVALCAFLLGAYGAS